MEQFISGGYYKSLSNASTKYNTLQGGGDWSLYEYNFYKIVSTGGKIKDLRVRLDGSPGAGKSYDFTLMLNGAPTALTLEIADAATSGADTTHEVDVVAGDLISLRCVPTGSPTVRYATWTSIFEGSTAKESLIFSGTSNALSKTAIEYLEVMCDYSIWMDNEVYHRQVCPTSGKIKNLYVLLSDDPGRKTDAYRFTLRVNGVDSALTVTIVTPATEGNDTTHEVTVAAGDTLSLKCEPIDGPANAPFAQMGLTFLADTDGESIILGASLSSFPPTITEYNYLQAACVESWAAIEAERYQLIQACTLKKLYVVLAGAPGAGKSYTFTLRKPGNGQADGNLTVTIADTDTTGSDTSHTDDVSDDDYVDLACEPSNSPLDSFGCWSFVCCPTGPPPVTVGRSQGHIIG